jgi:hypothetical protein
VADGKEAVMAFTDEEKAKLFLEAKDFGAGWGVYRMEPVVNRVLAFFIDHFAWNARAQLNTDIVLDAGEENAVLIMLADFLWEHRHAGKVKKDN